MLTALRDKLLNNWPIKLTAIVLATVLWAAVAAQEPTTSLVPVSLVIDPPEGRALTQPVPTVRALYAGSTRELLKLYGAPPLIRKTIPDTLTALTYTLELEPGDLLTPSGVDVQARDVEPRLVQVGIGDVSRRILRVLPRVSVRPDSGYDLIGPITVTPPTVTVAGPMAQIQGLGEIRTVTHDIDGARATVTQELAIDTALLGVIRVTPLAVMVTIPIGPVSERVLMGVPVTMRGRQASLWSAEPLAVLVTVRGAKERLLTLTRDSVEVIAVPAGTGATLETVRLEVAAPAGIEAAATPDSAVLRRKRR
jgi:YbbR domain-containing protein